MTPFSPKSCAVFDCIQMLAESPSMPSLWNSLVLYDIIIISYIDLYITTTISEINGIMIEPKLLQQMTCRHPVFGCTIIVAIVAISISMISICRIDRLSPSDEWTAWPRCSASSGTATLLRFPQERVRPQVPMAFRRTKPTQVSGRGDRVARPGRTRPGDRVGAV